MPSGRSSLQRENISYKHGGVELEGLLVVDSST